MPCNRSYSSKSAKRCGTRNTQLNVSTALPHDNEHEDKSRAISEMVCIQWLLQRLSTSPENQGSTDANKADRTNNLAPSHGFIYKSSAHMPWALSSLRRFTPPRGDDRRPGGYLPFTAANWQCISFSTSSLPRAHRQLFTLNFYRLHLLVTHA